MVAVWILCLIIGFPIASDGDFEAVKIVAQEVIPIQCFCVFLSVWDWIAQSPLRPIFPLSSGQSHSSVFQHVLQQQSVFQVGPLIENRASGKPMRICGLSRAVEKDIERCFEVPRHHF